MKTVILSTPKEIAQAVGQELPKALLNAERSNPDKLYTITQAAALLEKHRRTIKNMVRAGRLATTADGRYISRKAIDDYLNSQK